MNDKYVSFRIEKESLKGAQNEISHDFRLHIPKYLKRSSDNNVLLTYDDTFFDNPNVNGYNEIQRERVKRLTGRKPQASAMFFMSGIMTFSPTMAEDQKNNPDLFEKCSLDFIKQLEEKHNLQPLYSVLHLDETTPHIHILLDNVSRKDGKGIDRRTKPKDLSNIQTLMGDCFAPMDYKRGKPVSETHSKHLPVQTLHKLEEIKEALGDDINKLDNLVDLYTAKNTGLMMLLNILSRGKKINFKSEKVQNAIDSINGEGGNDGNQGQTRFIKPRR